MTSEKKNIFTQKSTQAVKNELKSIIKFLSGFFIVITLLYQPFTVPTGSMIPTILIGDYLIVNKFSYGYNYLSIPFLAKFLPASWQQKFSDKILFSVPKRGDIVVFNNPKDGGLDYIKRLIGLPGDKIQIIGGVLHINNQPVKLQKTIDFTYVDNHGIKQNLLQYIETLPNGVKHNILQKKPMVNLNSPVYHVPAGHYFMMGDNRDNSADSRKLEQVGYVPATNLIGKAEILVFSTTAKWYTPWNWFSLARYERILKKLI